MDNLVIIENKPITPLRYNNLAPLIGRKFGNLKLIRPTHIDQYDNTICQFECDCGKHFQYNFYRVRYGKKLSCGSESCTYSQNNKHRRKSVRALIGFEFGLLTILGFHSVTKLGQTLIEVKCRCGRTAVKNFYQVRDSVVESCGECCTNQFQFKKYEGKYMGDLKVLSYVGKVRGAVNWMVECSCGKTKPFPVKRKHLLNKQTTKCSLCSGSK